MKGISEEVPHDAEPTAGRLLVRGEDDNVVRVSNERVSEPLEVPIEGGQVHVCKERREGFALGNSYLSGQEILEIQHICGDPVVHKRQELIVRDVPCEEAEKYVVIDRVETGADVCDDDPRPARSHHGSSYCGGL